MPHRTKGLLFILFAFTLLGCAVTARLQDGTGTPKPTQTQQDAVVPATETLRPTESKSETATGSPSLEPSHTSTATGIPVPSDTPPVEPPSITPSHTPTAASKAGPLQEQVDAPPPLPTNVTLVREPASLADHNSAAALAISAVPVRDLRDLAIRLRGVRSDVPNVISDISPDYELGTVRTFSVHDDDQQETFIVEAELRYKTEHLYMWVERGVDVNQGRLEAAADTFEDRVYPANRAFFGSEWTPGVDGDPHLSILHARQIGSRIAGYYSSADQYPTEVRPDSNQMEMFYINADNADVGSASYLSTLTHEFQHMIHWYNDRNEESWLNEGLSELAGLINGFDHSGFAFSWAVQPDTQLNTWSDDSLPHYGGSFLFTTYLLDRFGEDLTQAVVAHPDNGISSIDAVLAANQTGLTFNDLFADWVVAVYLDDPAPAQGRFDYELIDPVQPELDAEHDRYPVERFSDVSQYGVDYIYLRGGTDLLLDFYGETRVRLLDTDPHSGQFFWYANRGDDSDMRLTHAFDLGDLSQATLRFWTWYDIETDWDYGYVMISSDQGATWQILRGPSTTDANPHGNSYGWGYTGASGAGPKWIEEQIDLSAFVGQQVLVRFEYITDDAINLPGWAIDDISVPELGYLDDVESGASEWLAEGFVRTNNHVPQSYMVQLVKFGSETEIQRLSMGENQTARWHLSLAEADHGVLLISGLAPVTTESAAYYYHIAPE